MNSRSMFTAAGWAALALSLALPACSLGDVEEGGVDAGATTPPPTTPPPTTPPIVPQPDVYVRGSMQPIYQLTPQGEFGRFEINGVTMNVGDFQANAVATSAEQKLIELGAQIGAERGLPPMDLFIDGENQTRAARIPFRGNPTDVKRIEVDGQRKLYVPLGGDFTTPGNEVTSVNLDNGNTKRIRVGIRPQRVVTHQPSGLVFVANQFSNYVSIIDSRFDEVLTDVNGDPVEIPTEFYATDLLLVERNVAVGEEDELFLYVANMWRGSVLKYSIDIIRDINDDIEDVEINPPDGKDEHVPVAEISGVGKNPFRLALDESQSRIFVANNRGGELSVFNIATDTVEQRIALNAVSADVVQIADKVYVPTTTPFRGLINGNSGAIPEDVNAAPVMVTGVDGNQHEAHPGALFDGTDSYNFSDLRDGVFIINQNLTGTPVYETNDNEVDDFFNDAQKQLAGALPTAIVRNEAGNKVYMPLSGSDLVQEFNVVAAGQFRLVASGLEFQTRERPFAVALDEDNQELYSIAWGGEVLEVFDLANGDLLETIDLGYANPQYPATTMEVGEYIYQTAKWSNDGRKSCATCHFDELLTDGIGYANGATAPTSYHQVKPNYNLLETDNYFWNGTFVNNSYTTLAFEAQARTNCEVVLFGFVEGPDSDPAQRVGDPANFTADAAQDVLCRPDTANLVDGLPGNLNGQDFVNGIAPIIEQQKQLAGELLSQAVGEQLLRAGLAVTKDDASRSSDYYGAAELRLPPNPIVQLDAIGALGGDTQQKLANGERIFRDVANCDSCHDPDNSQMPFADGRDHGRGADWIQDFINTYNQDAELLALVPGGVPNQMQQSAASGTTTQEINFHHDPLDFFQPFCFDDTFCLRFEDPLVVRGQAVEDERLRRLVLINLADVERGFVPGQVIGQARVNTPSLRGVWLQHNLLRHGLAFSINEAILPPGHAALKDGEKGFAVNARGEFDAHGETENLTPDQVEDLVLYVQSIE